MYVSNIAILKILLIFLSPILSPIFVNIFLDFTSVPIMVPHTVTHLDLHRQKINQLREDICSQKPQLIEILFNENIIDHIEYGYGFYFRNAYFSLTRKNLTKFSDNLFSSNRFIRAIAFKLFSGRKILFD